MGLYLIRMVRSVEKKWMRGTKEKIGPEEFIRILMLALCHGFYYDL
jgi:hypothetical protein